MTFEKWLTSALPKNTTAVWGEHVTGCGEQTGNPEIDSERDMPLCAEVTLKKERKTIGYLSFFIGTEKKGKFKKKINLYSGYIQNKKKIINLKKINELIILMEDQIFNYKPLFFDGNGFLLKEELINNDHFDRVEHVLNFYGIKHKRTKKTEIVMESPLDLEIMWNYTNKAEDNEWLNTHEAKK